MILDSDSRGYDEYYLLGNVTQCGRNSPAASCSLLHTGLSLCLLCNPEDGGDMFLRNVGWFGWDALLINIVKPGSPGEKRSSSF
jgi:hypothetical protein